MDHESLRTASTYLNNLLLARGLLRNGEPIDFVKPSRDSRAQIINLVHDLILKEDREKDQREKTVDTLRHLRAEDARKNHDIERLTTRNDESARATTQAQTAERAAQVEVKKVEKALKALQEQHAKLKTTLAQVRTQCTNDVRKRDVELARLKTHLQGQQRGSKIGAAAPSINVRASRGEQKTVAEVSSRQVQDAEYSLKQETTEFLTQLSQSLSEENDGLIGIVRSTLSTLKDLLGLPLPGDAGHSDSAIGSIASEVDKSRPVKSTNVLLHALPTPHEVLADEMESALTYLQTLLTNPSFVSVEEVELREEEIGRLRQGWEHMEHRWVEVLQMMESWRRRMDTGETINIDDLRKGMGLVSPARDVAGSARRRRSEPEQSFAEGDVSDIQIADLSNLDDSSVLMSAAEQTSASKPQPLLALSKRKRDILEPPESFDLRPASRKHAPPISPPRSTTAAADHVMEEGDQSEELVVPQMTIAEKLLATREEAEQALRDQKPDVDTGNADAVNVSMHSKEDDTLGRMPSPMTKRTKIRGRPRKRKSTLSPDELQALMNAD